MLCDTKNSKREERGENMKYNEYKFVLSEYPNPYNIHAIVSTLIGKNSDVPYSISSVGLNMVIKTTKNLDIPNGKLKIKHSNGIVIANLEDLSFMETVSSNESFNIKSTLSYGVNKKNKISCPVWKGGFDLDKLSDIFRFVGLELVKIKNTNTYEAFRGKKVEIYNIFDITAEVKVLDQNLWDIHQIKAIGQRKSYGFGAIEII